MSTDNSMTVVATSGICTGRTFDALHTCTLRRQFWAHSGHTLDTLWTHSGNTHAPKLLFSFCILQSLPFFRKGHYWLINDMVGEEHGVLRAKMRDPVQICPPVDGWHYCAQLGSSKWFNDPSCKCSPQITEPCKEVKVELLDKASRAGNHPLAGDSTPTTFLPVEGMYRWGRQVIILSTSTEFLCITLSLIFNV